MYSLLLVTACGGERPYTHYDALSEAIADGAIQRGWVPDWVPPAAVDIHEQHDLDTNRQYLRFSLPPTEGEQLRARLTLLSPAQVAGLDADCPFDANWWFDGLIQQEPENDAALNADLYRAQPSSAGLGLVVAIDRVGAQVFVWSQ